MLPMLETISLKNKKVFLRADLNVPIVNDKITSDIRIKSAIATIKYLVEHKAAVILVSHLGRPIADINIKQPEFSLQQIIPILEKYLGQKIHFKANWLDGVKINPGEVCLCDNVRFISGEVENSDIIAKKMASLCDVYVLDAFATAHRVHASTVGITKYVKEKAAGKLLAKELTTLNKAFQNPTHPLVAIVGGSKVSTKLTILENIIPIVDTLIVGGGIANTFLLANGKEVGKSLVELDLVGIAKRLMQVASNNNTKIVLPEDVVVADNIDNCKKAVTKSINNICKEDMIFDVGPKSSSIYSNCINAAATILWNGPIGVFELEEFTGGTKGIATAIANSSAFSIAGGGDTIAAIDKYSLQSQISYISTGGGAFLQYIEGKSLPAITSLSR